MSAICPTCGQTIQRKSALVIRDAGLKFASTPRVMSRCDYLVIHHTANANPAWGVKQCHDWHRRGNGWIGIGYNYLIEQSGEVFYGRSDAAHDRIGAHATGHNSHGVGVCLDGDYNQQTPTKANIDVLARLCAMLLTKWRLPATAIRYHRDVGNTTCPGKNFISRTALITEIRKHL